MITEHLAGSHPRSLFRSHERRRGGRYERGLANEYIDVRLRESLAREEGLLTKLFALQENAATRVASLTPRERQILELVLAGHPSKNIAADLGVSQRTVENHRASIIKKTGSKCVAALARFAVAASWNGAGEQPVQQSANSQEIIFEAGAAAS